MKKIISLVMTMTMLLSVFCCIPAKANLYEGYPYLSLDFEDSNSVSELRSAGVLGGNLGSTWKADGAAGSNGCVTVTDKASWANEDIHLPKPLIVGRTYRLGMWVRVNLDNFEGKTASMSTIIYTKSAVSGGSAYESVSLKGEILPNTWCYVSGEFVWDGIAADEGDKVGNKPNQNPIDPEAKMRICPRMGSTGSTLYMTLKALDKYKDDPTFAVRYDMDDIIIEPVPVEKEVQVYDDSYVLAADFENNSKHELGGISAIVEDPERGMVGYGKSNVGDFATVTAYDRIKVNHLYKISAWIKRTDDLCVFGGDTTQVACIGNPEKRVDFTNIAPNVKWPTVYPSNRITKQNEWTYFEFYLKYEARTFDAFNPSTGFRIGNLAASKDKTGRYEIGLEGVEYLVDDYMIQDLGLVSNGDFEQGETSVFRIGETAQAKATDSVLGWKADGVTVAASTDVRADAESTKSMKVSVSTDGGKAYQGMFLENNMDYKISFWAKGEGLADGETKPMNLILDRKVPTVHEKDVYEVLDYEELGDEWLLTNEWQQYECYYTTEFTTDVAADKLGNAVPRMPFVYLEVDGNKAGTNYLVDDFEIIDVNYVEPDTRYPYPRVDGVELEAEDGFVDGAKITFQYNFVSELDRMEGETVIRIMASDDNENWSIFDHIIADYGYAEYTIPQDALGRYLKAEILPIDENDGAYEMGDMFPVEMGLVSKSFIVEPEFTAWDEEEGAVSAQVYLENNLKSKGDFDVVAILAVYDENNTLIGMSNTPQHVVVGTPNTVQVSTSLAGTEGLTPACARLYVWSGTSLADAGEIIYTDAIEYSAAE